MTAPRARVARRPVHGVLLLDKPLGWSSNDALQKAKWLMRAEKAGHTGTLDPLATGVLPLCFGAATKFSQLQLDADKTYEARAQLGVKTNTGDAEGEVIEERPVKVTEEDLQNVLLRFTGTILQLPPMHSALKKDGRALYDYARAGIEVERCARTVKIYELKVSLENIDGASLALQMRVKCSKGTYIRTLAENIGDALGCGAHLTALRRIETGGFSVSQCVTLAALEAMTDQERLQCLLPVASLLRAHTVVTLDAEDAGRFLSGVRRRGDWPDDERVAVYGPRMTTVRAEPVEAAESPSTLRQAQNRPGSEQAPRALLGTAHIKAGELIPARLLCPPEIEQILNDCGTDRSAAELCPELVKKVNHEL